MTGHSRKRSSGVPRRRCNARPEKTTVLIVCEGKETERNYFDGLKRNDLVRSRFSITVKRGQGGSRQRVAQVAIDRKNEYGDDYDEVWCAMDVENDRNAVDAAVDLLKANSIRACLSNPAFEVWLLSHFEKTAKVYSNCDKLIADLNKHWQRHFSSKYDKADQRIYQRLAQRTDVALQNAQWTRENHHGLEKTMAVCNSATEVYALVRWLQYADRSSTQAADR